jgi:hypothetical protein
VQGLRSKRRCWCSATLAVVNGVDARKIQGVNLRVSTTLSAHSLHCGQTGVSVGRLTIRKSSGFNTLASIVRDKLLEFVVCAICAVKWRPAWLSWHHASSTYADAAALLARSRAQSCTAEEKQGELLPRSWCEFSPWSQHAAAAPSTKAAEMHVLLQ